MPQKHTSEGVLRRVVEIVAAVVMLAIGASLQVIGAQANIDAAGIGTSLLILGGVLVAFGGVVVSWIASSIISDKHAAEARLQARAEVDEKLDNLSRVLGQAAGQISQAVEQADGGQVPAATGFALVSQATRTIYGQVNEIGVIRGQRFDAAQLLDTASRLDSLARQLSSPGPRSDELLETQRELRDIQEKLAAATPQRQFGSVLIDCPYCSDENTATLGSLPGDTATTTCIQCNLSFNIHRASNGSAFARPRTASAANDGAAPQSPTAFPKWRFLCPKCQRPLGIRRDRTDAHVIACPSCISVLAVNSETQSAVIDDSFRLVPAAIFSKSGTRPKVKCPECERTIKTAVSTDTGFVCLCAEDKLAITVSAEAFSEYLRAAE